MELLSSDPQPLYRNRKPRWRAARRREAKAQGQPIPNRQEVWNVQVTALLAIPDAILRSAIVGLSVQSNAIWLRRGTAKLLIVLDRAAGGRSLVTKAEYKRCNLCNRPLLGPEAANRRYLIETVPEANSVPCSSNCQQDRDLKIWQS
jgi:hypothetical protein